MLLDRRRGEAFLSEELEERCDVHGFDAGEFSQLPRLTPSRKSADGIQVRPASGLVAELGREKFPEAALCLSWSRENEGDRGGGWSEREASFNKCHKGRYHTLLYTRVRYRGFMSPGSRNQNLDFLRTIAVLMVLGRHVNWLPWWTSAGWAGVDLFFVLSGFLISGLLFSEWKKRGTLSLRRFYVRRAFKIYPGLYALVAVTLAGSLYVGREIEWRRVLPEVTFFQNYFEGMFNHTWSLGVEEHFYIALPLLLYFMQRQSTQAGDPFRFIPAVFGAIALFCLVARLLVSRVHTGEAFYDYLYPTHLRIDGLMCGVTLSYWRHFRPNLFRAIQNTRWGWLLVAAAAVLLISTPITNYWTHTVGFTLLWLAFGWLTAWIIDFSPTALVSRIMNPMARLGVYSYSVYLWHMWISYRMERFAGLPPGIYFGLYVAAAFAWGIIMAKLIELPLLQVRNRYFPEASAQAVPLKVGLR